MGWKLRASGEGLVEDLHGIAAGDGEGDGQAHGVVQALDGGGGVAAQDEAVADGLHAEDAHVVLARDGQDFCGEAVVVRVHHVEGHLHGVEGEAVAIGGLDHAEMDLRALCGR